MNKCFVFLVLLSAMLGSLAGAYLGIEKSLVIINDPPDPKYNMSDETFSRVIAEAKQNDTDAELAIAKYYLFGKPKVEGDDLNEGIYWLIRASKNGNEEASTWLSILYKGFSVDNMPWYRYIF